MVKKVTKQDIKQGLLDLGLTQGTSIMVHSSLSSFGWVKGGASTVVDVLIELLGPEGTLIVPTFSNYLQGDEDVWDREHTPSKMGAISEEVRRRSDSLRSNQAAHSLAAIGPRAEMFCRQPYQTGFGKDSPFKTMVEINTSILLMGVSYNSCTLFHLLEVEVDVPYRFLEKREATIIIDGNHQENGFALEYTRKDGAQNNFRSLGKLLEKRGLVKIGKIGSSTQKLFKAGDVYRVGLAKLKEDPLFLLSEETKANWQ